MIKMIKPDVRSRPNPGRDAIKMIIKSSSSASSRRPRPNRRNHLILLLFLSFLLLLIQAPSPVRAQIQDRDHDHNHDLDLEHDPSSSSSPSTPCLRNTTSKHLNSLFSENGPSTRILLCQSAVVELTSPIIFTAKDQEIATEGYPEVEEKKATLRLVGGRSGTAVQGDCRRCARVALKNIIIDGNRRLLGRIPEQSTLSTFSSSSSSSSILSNHASNSTTGEEEVDGDGLAERLRLMTGSSTEVDSPAQEEESQEEVAGSTSPLILLGNNEGQEVSGCTIKDPRGWTAIQIREGDNLSCKLARIVDNTIGPAGEEWVEGVDGDDPDDAPGGRPLASGLSLACQESVVSGNTFVDITDASMVIYGSPGSLIENNHVYARHKNSMAGILLSDSLPWDGNYTDTRVLRNTIEADKGTLMRVGIGLGASVLSDDTDSVFFGGVVVGNVMKGDGMGYGIAASGLKDFTVVDNMSTARHGGTLGQRCLVPLDEDEEAAKGMTEEEREMGIVKNPKPVAFLKNSKFIEGGRLQEDFVDSDFFYLVCLDPDNGGKAPAPFRKPKPKAKAETAEDEGLDNEIAATIERLAARVVKHDDKDTKVSIMDRIISHSQTKMLEAIAALGVKIEILVQRAGLDKKAQGNPRQLMGDEGTEILAALAHLSGRIGTLERERRNTRETLDNFRRELLSLGRNLDRAKAHDQGVLLELSELTKPESWNSGAISFAPVFAKAMSVKAARNWSLAIAYYIGVHFALGGLYFAWKWARSSRNHHDKYEE